MTLQTWWLFVTMAFVLSATPGPNMLLVMSSSARLGFRAAIATMAGCMTALLTMMSVSAAGLGAVLQAFPSVFDALRWDGAAYLVYLGIKSWRAPVPEIVEDASQATRRQPRKSAALFRRVSSSLRAIRRQFYSPQPFCPNSSIRRYRNCRNS